MKWIVHKWDAEAAGRLAAELGLHPVTAGLLARRGFSDPTAARQFLRPSLKDLPDPFLLPDLDKAAARLIEALRRQEPLVVYGDYDADGLSAAVLASDYLASLGFRVEAYIPHRLEEGYGLNRAAVEKLAAAEIKLILTVDCGVSDFEAVTRANELGLDVIVTDHHRPPDRLPPAAAVVNPQRADSLFPQRGLAGVGVSFFVMGGLRLALKKENLLSKNDQPELAHLLGLVAIGTIADVMPLTMVNRILVSHGLLQLASPRRPGLAALKEIGALEKDRPPTARDVAFRLAPRLNAAGRLGSALPALEVLRAVDEETARKRALDLEELNRKRQNLQARVFKEALSELDEGEAELARVIVLARDGWPRGVVGLTASKLAERFNRPAILLTYEDGLAVGSGRSVRGFDLFAALDRCRDLMERFGGHRQAAGMSLQKDRVPHLAAALDEIARSEIAPEDLEPCLEIDAAVTLSELEEVAGQLPWLAPFGQGNPDPVFVIDGLEVVSAAGIGAGGAHLKLILNQGGSRLETIGFGLGDRLPELGRRVSAAFKRHTSRFRGRVVEGWQVVGVRKSGGD